ncbi:hypothetical protein ACWDFR_03610 [Streptomyces sp. 900105755]
MWRGASAAGVETAGVALRPSAQRVHTRAGDASGVRLVLGYAHLPAARGREGVRVMARAVDG